MRKQLIWAIAIAVGVMVLGGILFYAQPKDQDHSAMNVENSGNPLNLKVDPLNYDFGTISMKNGLVTKFFKVKNIQTNDIDLSTVYTSCMCTSAKFVIDGQEYGPFGMQGHGTMKMLNKKLTVGQEAELVVTFYPHTPSPSQI